MDDFPAILEAAAVRGLDPLKAKLLWSKGHRNAETIWQLDSLSLSALVGTGVAMSAPPPPAALSRADHPLVRPTARCSRTWMFEAIATPEGRDAALAEVDATKEILNTKRTSDSLWLTWCEVLRQWGEEPLPMTPGKVRQMAAALRAGRYRSAEPYFHRARVEHIMAYDKLPGPSVLDAIRQYTRTVERGAGPAKLKEALPLELGEHEFAPPDAAHAVVGPRDEALWPGALVCLGAWWMTRGIEASATKTKHMAFDESRITVSWCLLASKTDWKAMSATRTHRCRCLWAARGSARIAFITLL